LGAPINVPDIRLNSSLRDRDWQESVFSSMKSILADFGLEGDHVRDESIARISPKGFGGAKRWNLD
jgi:hypothetical protein